MDPLANLRLLFAYGDEMNRRLLAAAALISEDVLDRPTDMGVGSLRKTLAHVLIGEQMWLRRQTGEVEANWPPYETTQTPTQMLEAFGSLQIRRDAFVDTIDATRLDGRQPYRDSAGTLYVATLREMLLEGIVHSTHHRAQAVHLLKRAGGKFVELDFMYWRRQPA